MEVIDKFMEAELKEGTFPGAVLGIVNETELLYQNSFGYAWLEPKKIKMNSDTIFDLASLTKVVVTTTAVMQLIERGEINLWNYLKEYYPDLSKDKEEITIFHLLTHSSGFQAVVELWELDLSYEEKIRYILDLSLEYETGKRVVYSDPNFILLGDLIWKVTGQRLDQYVGRNISGPLGMNSTVFNPLTELSLGKEEYAATEFCGWRNKVVIGEVHDENCYSLNGVSGHAGLFSNLQDLSIFTRMLLNKGSYRNIRILNYRSIEIMRRNWTGSLAGNRGLGWDLVDNYRSSGGVLFTSSAFGHTGFTGTSIWLDPELKVGVILLTNRIHPKRDNVRIISMRPRLHNLIVSSLFSN